MGVGLGHSETTDRPLSTAGIRATLQTLIADKGGSNLAIRLLSMDVCVNSVRNMVFLDTVTVGSRVTRRADLLAAISVGPRRHRGPAAISPGPLSIP